MPLVNPLYLALSDVLAITRTYLNDDNAAIWSDAALIPKVQEAHRQLQMDLWLRQVPLVRGSADSVVNAGGTVIVNNGSPPNGALPTDLLAPFQLEESPEPVPTPPAWVPMTEVYDISSNSVVGFNTAFQTWMWRNGQIFLPYALAANRRVRIRYRKLIAIPSLLADPIGIPFGEIYLGSASAALAAASVGNKAVFDTAMAYTKENYEKLLISLRGQQNPVTRT